MSSSCDVLVVGAGAAGLSACRELTRAGLNVICLEARDRIGGRALTIVDPLSPLPIELGPEFVHGRPPESWEIIQSGRLIAFDSEENAVHIADGKVQKESDSWDQVAAITDAMKAVAASGEDPTFLDFLRPTDFSDEAKALATSYVEGFNAAHKEDVSVASLAKDAAASEAISGDYNFRIANGYNAFMRVLSSGIDERFGQLRLSTVVRQIQWSPGSIIASVQLPFADAVEAVTAQCAVITLPLGVLQADRGEAGFVEFIPLPNKIFAAARALRFGHVLRLVLRFSHPWWQDHPDLQDAGFWLSDEEHFPTWWNNLPVRSTMLVGWSAGPHCDSLLGASREVILRHALHDLGRIANLPPDQLRSTIDGVYFQDWSLDPFARGSYSYVPAGAMWARPQLAEPVENTLYFAGEAAEIAGHGATVHGAIASGRRAAELILKSWPK